MMRPLAGWIDRGARRLAAVAGALAMALAIMAPAAAQKLAQAATPAASAAIVPIELQHLLEDAPAAGGLSPTQAQTFDGRSGFDAKAPGTPAAVALHPRPVASALALLGIVVLAIGWLHTRRSDLLYLGLLALGAAALSAGDWLGAAVLPAGRAGWLGLALAPLVAACAVLFLMRYAGLRARAFDAALLAQCAIVPASLLLAGPQRLAGLATTWQALLALEVLIAAGVMLWRARRLRPREFWILCGLCGVMAMAIVFELARRGFDAGDDSTTGWLELVLPLAFIALGLRLVYSEVVMLRLIDANARTMIDKRVGEAAADAERTFAQLAELRIEQVIERERKRIAADLHDDLGAKLLTIVHTSESDRISTLAREALEEMRLSVRGLTGKPVRLADALGDWRAEFVSRLGQANIGAQWQSPAEELPQTLPARAYVQTTRILREAISNIIKHSGAARCTVSSKVQDGDFVLTIQDNGHGIPMELGDKLDRGHGMASMKHRAKQLQGQCLVESGPGFGTVIRLTIPL
jgi:two-component system, NarL family, sensor histidine kinase UhpB